MKIFRTIFTVFARFCISLVFLSGAISKIFHWHESETTLHAVLCDWQSNLGFFDRAHECFGILIPLTPLLLLLATVLEFLGGLAVLLNVKEKLGATMLVIFLVPTTIIMHQFWFVDGNLREQQMVHFFKNLAILGGLIIIILQGTDQKQQQKQLFSKF